MTSVPTDLGTTTFPFFGEAVAMSKGPVGVGEVLTFGAPRALIARIQETCPGLNIVAKPLSGVYSSRPSLFVVGFCYLLPELTRAVPAFKRLVAPGGNLWVLWPRAESWDAEAIRPEMGVTEEAVQRLAASLGLALAGRAEVDDVWTAAKLASPV